MGSSLAVTPRRTFYSRRILHGTLNDIKAVPQRYKAVHTLMSGMSSVGGLGTTRVLAGCSGTALLTIVHRIAPILIYITALTYHPTYLYREFSTLT